MNIFIDANVLVAVLNKEYPVFSFAARVLSLADDPSFNLYTTSLSLAIGFYFSSKKSGEKLAKQKIGLIAQKIHLATVSQKAVNSAITNKKIHDLEDGFQYYAAHESGCQVIITEDQNDFYFSEIKVSTCEAFLKNL